MTTCSSRATLAAVVVLGALAPVVPAARAQDAGAQDAGATRPTVTLDEVIRQARVGSPVAVRGRLAVDAAEGDLLVAADPFATEMSASMSELRSRSAALAGGAALDPGALAYRVLARRRLRNGLLLEPSFDLREAHGVATAPYAATAGLALVVPLARDRGGVQLTSLEAAAEARRDAAVADAAYLEAQAVHDAAAAYWTYLGAVRRLGVRRDAESRAARIVADMRTLVAADERPAADLNQVLANLTSRRIARVGAEQDELAARRRLGLSMGLAPAAIDALGAPGTDFADLGAGEWPTGTLPALRDSALAIRADLRALRELEVAVARDLRGTRNGTRPQIDLVTALRLEGTAARTAGASLDALGSSRGAGRVIEVGVQYAWPLGVPGARGRLQRDLAARAQIQVALAERERDIVTGVALAVEGVRRAELAVGASRDALALYETAVTNERQRYAAGVATVLDVVLAEDALTGAQLDVVARRVAHATALVDLRFATGTLLPPGSAATPRRIRQP